MKRTEDAEHLAKMMVATGERMGKRMAALITDMNQPLGRAVGNSLEVRECLEILRGDCQPMSKDLLDLSLELAAWMFYLGGRVESVDAGRSLAEKMIANRSALQKFCQMCREQGAHASFKGKPEDLPAAKFTAEFNAPADGFIESIQCEQVGLASLVLGGGRNKQDDVIDLSVGFELFKKTGDAVKNGEPIARVHYNDGAKLGSALAILKEAYRIGPKPAEQNRPLIKKIIESRKKT